MDETYGQPYAAPPRRPSGKAIAIAAGAAIVLVALGVGGWLLYSRNGSKERAAAQLSELARMEAASCPDGASSCEAARVGAVAERSLSAEPCRLLEGEDFDNCVWGVAMAAKDPQTCASVADEWSRVTCMDGIREALGREGDISQCAGVSTAERRQRCENLALGPVTAANCAQRGKGEAYCADLALFERVVKGSDPAACASIADEGLRENCVDSVGYVGAVEEPVVVTPQADADADADGLTASQEAAYGTSDANPDTDGDGFKDGDEVKAGYDPNGPGKL